MRLRNLLALALSAALACGAAVAAGGTSARPAAQTPARYRLDPARSTFIVRAHSGGLLWFKGHDHLIAAREFAGEARLAPDSVNTASLQLTVRAGSLAETREVFTEQQKQIINRELRQLVLEPDKYPEITFKSTSVEGTLSGGVYKLKIAGDLTLRGTTRRVQIPAEVTVSGRELRARGDFNIDRSDFGVPATSAFHGLVRVRDRLKVSFDIVGTTQ
jgi:polyisoprenoid-binding protein YceI